MARLPEHARALEAEVIKHSTQTHIRRGCGELIAIRTDSVLPQSFDLGNVRQEGFKAHRQPGFARLGLVSYGLSAKLVAETLPLGRPLHATAVRWHAQATAERLEHELGPEQSMFIDGCQRDWDELPRPDLPLTVGLDGGYVHSSQQRSRRDGWFEVIAGKSMPADGPAKSFGFVQTYDTKPKRRLFEVLPTSQGLARSGRQPPG